MSYATPAGLGLAGLLWAAVALDPAPASPDVAVTREPHLAWIQTQVDPARDRVWSLTGSGVTLHDHRKGQQIVLPLPGWLWAGAPYGCPPRLALGPRGEVIVTSDVLPKLWRIDPQTLAVTVHAPALDSQADRDAGFAALSYSARHGAYFAQGSTPGSLWRIDPTLSRGQSTPLAASATPRCGLALAH